MRIKKCKKVGNDKYRVTFDNNQSTAMFEDVIVKNNLLGKEIDAKTLLKINEDNTFYDIYSKALRQIAVRLRSTKEMETFLAKKELTPKEICEVIDKLKAIGLLNDRVFATAYVNDKLNLTNQGFNKIRQALEEHDISEEMIEEVIAKVEVDYDARIKNIATKQVRLSKGKHGSVLRNKVYNYLINLGYESDAINRNLKIEEETLDLEIEYERIYQKIIKKKDNKDFKSIFKNKLYQNGIDYSYVDEFLSHKKSL